jgi:hypothetical protein
MKRETYEIQLSIYAIGAGVQLCVARYLEIPFWYGWSMVGGFAAAMLYYIGLSIYEMRK